MSHNKLVMFAMINFVTFIVSLYKVKFFRELSPIDIRHVVTKRYKPSNKRSWTLFLLPARAHLCLNMQITCIPSSRLYPTRKSKLK